MTEPPLATLRRIAHLRPAPPAERCDLCATAVAAAHGHVVDRQTRAVRCACRACYLLFTDDHADLRFRAVPDRYLSFGGPVLTERDWAELEIPVGLAFLVHDSARDRMVAYFPGPAGAIESEVDLPSRYRFAAAVPALRTLRPDVEALLVRCGADGYLVPIDACYELVGRLRTVWRGVDGGRAAQDAVDQFFATVRDRSRPAPPEGAP